MSMVRKRPEAGGQAASPWFSPAVRVTLVMSCLFSTTGVTLVFLPRWLEFERGLGGAEIGVVLSLAQLTRIFTGPLIAFWADGVADRRTPLRVVSAAALVAYAAFFFIPHDFWLLLAFGFVALSLVQALVPLIEAAALRATASGALNYGVSRSVGSISFIVATTAGGFLITRFGLGAVVVWTLSALALTLLSSVAALAPDAPRAAAHAVGKRERLNAVAGLLRERNYLTLILAAGLIQSAHAFYYGFSTLVWREQGLSADLVGLLWGFGTGVEVVFLLCLAPIERVFSPKHLLLLGAAGAALRWLAMGFAPTGAVLWPLQALHALSFAAAHVGAMRLLYRGGVDETAAMSQTIYSALAGGILAGAFMLISGVLYDSVGARGYWAMALIATLGGVIALSLRAEGVRQR